LINNNEDDKGVKPVGYTPDVDEYHKWLEEGIKSLK
jgi:hypothetical protein